MRKLFRIFKRILQVTIITLLVLYALLYTIVSLPGVQDKVRTTTEEMLRETLKVPLEISRIEISPFNRVEIYGVTIPDQQGDTLLYANKIGAGINLWQLAQNGRISLNNIQLFGVYIHITRANPSAETNVQFIIDAFTPQEQQEEKPIDLCINSALIRRSKIRYDVLSEPYLNDGCFDANHIAIHDITTSLSIKRLDKDSINAYIKRFSCKEKSGLKIDRVAMRVNGNHKKLELSEFLLQLPHTYITTEKSSIDMSNVDGSNSFIENAIFTLDVSQSFITLSDLSSLVPTLKDFNAPIAFDSYIQGTMNDLEVKRLSFNLNDDAILFDTKGHITDVIKKDSIGINFNPIHIRTSRDGFVLLGNNLGIKDKETMTILRELGTTTIDSRLKYKSMQMAGYIKLLSQIGDLQAQLTATNDTTKATTEYAGYIESDGLYLGKILGSNSKLGLAAFRFDGKTQLHKNILKNGVIEGAIDRIDYNQYSYRNIALQGKCNNNCYNGKIEINDPNGYISADGTLKQESHNTSANIEIACKELNLAAINLIPKAEGNTLSFDINAEYSGKNIDDAIAKIGINNIVFGNEEKQLVWNNILIDANNSEHPQRLTISSDYLDGIIYGDYTISTLPTTLQNLAAPLLPSLLSTTQTVTTDEEYWADNNLKWDLSIRPYVEMAQMLKLPFILTDTANINGYIKDSEKRANLNVSIPNIWIGKTHIEDVSLHLNHNNSQLDMIAQAGIMNIKKEFTVWSVTGNAKNDNIDVGVHWNTNTQKTYCGSIKLNSQFSKSEDDDKDLDIAVNILPTDIIINDTTWNIKPAHITIDNKDIAINRLEVSRPSQHIYIDGMVSENPGDTLHVDLQDINLDYIFETLNIDFVTFGGQATGRVDAANLYSQSPYLCTKELDIQNFSYNDAVFGDLAILGQFDTSNMGILLKGNITNHRGEESFVDGYIFPTQDSISISFNIDHAPLKFIQPFVQQIFSDISGEASGNIVLEGNFARIYIYGDAYAHDFSFGVPFLNTQYHMTDSIHFTDRKIFFNNVVAYDKYGNTAIADGEINHQYFMHLDYNIDIHDADNLLVFNIPNSPGAMYYGTIFGSGHAKIQGDDYHTNIEANMNTDKGSKFTFAITNTTSAIDYQFLTFSNKREIKHPIVEKTISKEDSLVALNNQLMELNIRPLLPPPPLSVSVIADITPEADVTIVMNEISGDKMKAKGEGELRLDFNTSDNEIQMFGTVTINNGNYNFSFEDIITRDFKINRGSSVSFQGNPLDANLNIEAIYQAQANLADLDNSFTTDSELSSTTVPVNTILKINGIMTQPNIGFDIELPTLSADMDSKIHSIISTEEMMTRQVIYLLAFNRFFTPEFNTGQGSANDLTSVATSTLTSSLSTFLGQINENWNISPKIRSELGDFSDVEVDLFLSSQLLNNRLIFNGNFGYRDSRYSSTNFIGDFDIEYLLTENGNLRLKGYNHFNDRNYSVRTALTTQGLGLMYKLDFNTWRNLFEFAQSKPAKEDKKENENDESENIKQEHIHTEQATDSVITTISDIFQ